MAKKRNSASGEIFSLADIPRILDSIKTPLALLGVCILSAFYMIYAATGMPEQNQLITISIAAVLILTVIVGAFIRIRHFHVVAPQQEVKESEMSSPLGLDEALRVAFERNRTIEVLRIYALTCGQIAPLIYQLIDRAGIQEVRIVLFDTNFNGVLPQSTVASIKENYEGVKGYLDQIQARVRRFSIRYQPFSPTEYYVLIDNKDLVQGWFKYDPSNFTGFRAQNPILMKGESALVREFLRRKADIFDTWFNHGRADEPEPRKSQ